MKIEPKQIGGFGYGQFGKQARMGNRVYDPNAVAVCLTAEPPGNRGGVLKYVLRGNRR